MIEGKPGLHKPLSVGKLHCPQLPNWVNDAHRMLEGSVRVVSEPGYRDLSASIAAPLDEVGFEFKAGRSYVVDIVVRTLTLGHQLTQGTADSNQLWVEVEAGDARGTFGRSGGMEKGRVDPYALYKQLPKRTVSTAEICGYLRSTIIRNCLQT